MLGYEDKFVVTHRDLAQSKIHNLAFRLRVWKENNYDKLREALNAWNTAERLLNGEIREVESSIEDIILNLRRRANEGSKQKQERT